MADVQPFAARVAGPERSQIQRLQPAARTSPSLIGPSGPSRRTDPVRRSRSWSAAPDAPPDPPETVLAWGVAGSACQDLPLGRVPGYRERGKGRNQRA
jgi:hypothetical protein